MFTVVFHFVHSVSHISSSLSITHQIEEELTFEHTHAFVDVAKDGTQPTWHKSTSIDKCFVCDSFLSPFISADIVGLEAYVFSVFEKIQTVKSQVYPSLSLIYFSLRAPPLAV